MTLRPYPQGLDFLWLASDRHGHVGAFITAGMGPLPEAALDPLRPPIEEVEEQLLLLPRMSRAELLVSVNRPDDFIDLAERGLFVFDWTDIHRPSREASQMYEPVAVPSEPLTVGALPGVLVDLANTLRLVDVVFSERRAVNVRAAFSCVEAAP